MGAFAIEAPVRTVSRREQQGADQIIVRNLLRKPAGQRALWINPGRDTGWQTAVAAGLELAFLCQEFGPYRFQRQASADAAFADFPDKSRAPQPWVILNLPRQKALLEMMLDSAASTLRADGVLWLAGENRAGIKSAQRRLASRFGAVTKLDNARHCSLYEARSPIAGPRFEARNYRQDWTLEHAGCRLEVRSWPGVFAHGRLDAGSACLLSVLAGEKLAGDVLDFGAGAGVVGACIARREPGARVTLLDSNALALRSCVETLAANRLSATLLASDGLSEVRDHYDVIVSNPPIHAGVRTDNTLGRQLLADVCGRLRPGGRLILVANIHLPYEGWLRQQFSSYDIVKADGAYKVISAMCTR